jgi:phenylalanyl-tRNA synthetase alpha chain
MSCCACVPSYFPFTEPSVEVDVGYSVVKGKRVIGGSEGWMEVLGSGMVHRRGDRGLRA